MKSRVVDISKVDEASSKSGVYSSVKSSPVIHRNCHKNYRSIGLISFIAIEWYMSSRMSMSDIP